jgi:hypothetical protein
MANLALNGCSLTLEDLVQAARNPKPKSPPPEAIPVSTAADAVRSSLAKAHAYASPPALRFQDRLIPPEDVGKAAEISSSATP